MTAGYGEGTEAGLAAPTGVPNSKRGQELGGGTEGQALHASPWLSRTLLSLLSHNPIGGPC